ncbi:MAG: ribonuclease Z [Gammaproteobacteria bacterium]|nr:ribonuclease Z [Gammaproteobacteria bacterium]
MEIIFLGTSSGVPTKHRNVSALAVKMVRSKAWYLVDCGEGTQHQILHTHLSLNNLQAIFITHMHGDHCYGLPGLLASATMSGRKDILTIIGPDNIREFIENTQTTTQMRLSYNINFINIENISPGYQVNDFIIEVVELSHRVPSFAYCFIEKNISGKLNIQKLKDKGIEPGPVWKQLQLGKDSVLSNGDLLISKDYILDARKPRKIIVAGDNDNPGLLAKSSKSATVLIHEATYTAEVADKVGKGPQHSSAKIIAQFAMDYSISNLILTHFSPRYQNTNKEGLSISDVESEAGNFYNGNLFLANDFDTFHLKQDGELFKVKSESKL